MESAECWELLTSHCLTSDHLAVHPHRYWSVALTKNQPPHTHKHPHPHSAILNLTNSVGITIFTSQPGSTGRPHPNPPPLPHNYSTQHAELGANWKCTQSFKKTYVSALALSGSAFIRLSTPHVFTPPLPPPLSSEKPFDHSIPFQQRMKYEPHPPTPLPYDKRLFRLSQLAHCVCVCVCLMKILIFGRASTLA